MKKVLNQLVFLAKNLLSINTNKQVFKKLYETFLAVLASGHCSNTKVKVCIFEYIYKYTKDQDIAFDPSGVEVF